MLNKTMQCFRLLKPLYSKGEEGETPKIVAFNKIVFPQHLNKHFKSYSP